MILSQKITLPCGHELPNRIGKSAMSENMATKKHSPGIEFYRLYHRWAKGGVGLCITGNVMVDSNYLGEPGNIVIEKGLNNLADLKNWANATKDTNTKLWVQLNHPGKQTPKFLCKNPIAPSSIPLRPPLDKLFNTPKELDESSIQDIIHRFAFAAKTCKESGFDGVQIHGAHGYLVSQFLNSEHNQRTDRWGGSLENRMRFVMEVYSAIRNAVGEKFPIGIKINTADFQKGKFSHQESIEIAQKLSEVGIDLIEISGGSYESPVMVNGTKSESTKKREAYFLEYARDIKQKISCPLMVTGGFRTPELMEEAIESEEMDIVGLARPLAINPDFPLEIMSGKNIKSQVAPLTTGFKKIDRLFPIEITWYTQQLHRMGAGKNVKPKASVYKSIFCTLWSFGVDGIKRVRS